MTNKIKFHDRPQATTYKPGAKTTTADMARDSWRGGRSTLTMRSRPWAPNGCATSARRSPQVAPMLATVDLSRTETGRPHAHWMWRMVEEEASGRPVAEGSPDDVPPTPTPPLKTLEKEAESLQAQGFDGKDAAKRYLESTTRITLPWNAYRHPARCTLQTLNGGHKRFDLAGYFFGSDNYVYVEVKNANAANNQTQEF
jgi:hypothetical protein